MNIKKFFEKTFPSLFPFKTTSRTYEVINEIFDKDRCFLIKRYCLIVCIYVKDWVYTNAYAPNNQFEQNAKYPCFNLKRKLIEGVYEAEVTYEGDLLPYIAVSTEKGLVLMPYSEEDLESFSFPKKYKDYIMPLMPQIQQAKELSAIKEAMKTGVQHDQTDAGYLRARPLWPLE